MSLNMHHKCFLVRNFVHTSGKRFHCVTSLSIGLGQSICICVRAFRLTSCVIRLTMLSLYAIFGRQSREDACMRHHKKANVVSLPLEQLCLAVLPSLHSLQWSLPEAQKKMNETRVKSFPIKKTFAC